MARSFTVVPLVWRWIASCFRRWAVVPVVRVAMADPNVNSTVERSASKSTLCFGSICTGAFGPRTNRPEKNGVEREENRRNGDFG